MKLCTLLIVTEDNDLIDVQISKVGYRFICISAVPDDHKFGVSENGKCLHLEGRITGVRKVQ